VLFLLMLQVLHIAAKEDRSRAEGPKRSGYKVIAAQAKIKEKMGARMSYLRQMMVPDDDDVDDSTGKHRKSDHFDSIIANDPDLLFWKEEFMKVARDNERRLTWENKDEDAVQKAPNKATSMSKQEYAMELKEEHRLLHTKKMTMMMTARGGKTTVNLRLGLNRPWKESNFKWRVVSEIAGANATASSETTRHYDIDDALFQVVSKFAVTANDEYFLILDGLEQEEQDSGQEPASVTVSLCEGGSGDILTEKKDLPILSQTHVIPFTLKLALIEENKHRELQEPKPPPTPAPIRPTDDQPNPGQGPATNPTDSGPRPDTPGVAPVTAPGPGTPSIDPGAAPGDATTAPTTFDGTRPPVISSINTPQPSVSAMPSSLPTIEPFCISTTNGPIEFSNYIAARFRLTNEGAVPNNSLQSFVSDIAAAYNNVATCRQKGAFRLVDQAELVQVYEGGGTSSEIEVIVRLTGSCEGCSASVNIFSRAREIDDLPSPGNDNNRQLAADPCFCPPPTRLVFLNEFNRLQGASLQRQASSIDIVLDVTELENAASCDVVATTQQQEAAPQVHTARVSVVLSRNPDEMSNNELDQVLKGFRDVFHARQALTYGTCDLSRKEILSVEVDPDDRIIGRRLRGSVEGGGDDLDPEKKSAAKRHLQQTSADSELMLEVTFQCFGCQGRLFSETNFTDPPDCLCPIDPEQTGVETNSMLSPWNEALDVLLVDQSVSDVIEVEALDCSSSFNIFSAVVVVEYSLPTNLTTPTDTDIEALEGEYNIA
jgi:hypothetical protein